LYTGTYTFQSKAVGILTNRKTFISGDSGQQLWRQTTRYTPYLDKTIGRRHGCGGNNKGQSKNNTS
jgi:hypothetical protein